MITLKEYGKMSKQEAKNILKEIDINTLDNDDKQLYYLMCEGLSMDWIKEVIQDNYERMVTPSVSAVFEWEE